MIIQVLCPFLNKFITMQYLYVQGHFYKFITMQYFIHTGANSCRVEGSSKPFLIKLHFLYIIKIIIIIYIVEMLNLFRFFLYLF